MDVQIYNRTYRNLEPISGTPLYFAVGGRGKNPRQLMPALLIEDDLNDLGWNWAGSVRKLHGYQTGRFEVSCNSPNAYSGTDPWSRAVITTSSLEEAERLLIEIGKILYA